MFKALRTDLLTDDKGPARWAVADENGYYVYIHGHAISYPLSGVAECVAREAAKRLNRRAAEREAAERPAGIVAAAKAIEDRFFNR